MENNDILKIKERRYQGETEVISARLPSDLVKELSCIAKETGHSRNEIVEMCLSFAVSRIKIEKAD